MEQTLPPFGLAPAPKAPGEFSEFLGWSQGQILKESVHHCGRGQGQGQNRCLRLLLLRALPDDNVAVLSDYYP